MVAIRSAAILICSCLLYANFLVRPALSQTSQPGTARVLVGYPPGGGSDIVARLTAQKLSESLKQNFIVENRVGGSGIVAAQAVAAAKPDGAVLLVAPSTQVITPAMIKTPYDVIADFSPITLLANGPYVLTLSTSLAAGNVKDLIAYAKANPGKLRWGLSSQGAGDHIAVEMFNRQASINTLIVPYKGAGPALTDLLGGRIDAVLFPVSAVMPQVTAGKLKALAVSSNEPADAAPGVPPISGSGLPGYQFYTWFGLWGPKGMTPALMAQFRSALVSTFNSPEMKKRFSDLALAPVLSSPDQFAEYVQEEVAKYAKVVTEARITAD